MSRYLGTIEDGQAYEAEAPFIVTGWPTTQSIAQFNTVIEAKGYMSIAATIDERATVDLRLYGFSNGRWIRLNIPRTSQPAISSLTQPSIRPALQL